MVLEERVECGRLGLVSRIGLLARSVRHAPSDAAPASGAYRVERCTSGRPSGATMASRSSTPIRCPCCGAGGPRDVLVHQRAAEVVGPGPQHLARPLGAHLDPAHLNVVDVARVGDARHRVHQQRLAEGRAPPGLVLEVDRGGHVHEGQRHELGEAARLALQGPGAHHVAGPAHRVLDRAEHDGDVGAQADAVRRAVRLEPLLGVDLVGADDGAHLVVEDLGRRARQRLQARRPSGGSGTRPGAPPSGARPRSPPAR